jgi:hypothetical protein
VLVRPAFVPFPRGRHVVQHLMRDLWIHCVVERVAEGTGLEPTRGRSTKAPSAAFFVARALRKKGFAIGEPEVNQIFAKNVSVAAAALEATMPALT